ncbi:hypothetical protein [Halopelagius longus]|uniref:Uncharacterized protein n=1 Tax=Halopelagius longus TaxID=1236180 RepID=A0A1H1GL52_9EURY|nr:hypothetical protein [Halopelagius longus]RDI69677.1 hypothetical protein DWB78_18065 [Halopelagius longus]SDR13859.1 hypothetical protein SAMN05216278_3741 [Halopelagius longus]
MAENHSIEAVEEGDDYYHVRYADPDEFDEIRTPDWAENAAGSVLDGSEVRTGHQEGGGDDDWETQSVLVPVDGVDGEDEARSVADDIVAKISE